MAVHTNEKNEKAITIQDTDLRKIRFYKNHIASKGVLFYLDELDDNYISINKTLFRCIKNTKERNTFINEMRTKYNSTVIQRNEFNWIKENDRYCYWAWINIRSVFNVRGEPEFHGPMLNLPLYERMIIDRKPSSTNERYNAIISFFDQLDKNIDTKRNYLSYLKESLGSMSYYLKSFNWLNENDDEQCNWAFRYITTGNTNIFNPYIITSTLSTKEIYLTIITSFDTWYSSPAEKELFLIKIKKAWSQKKYRDETLKKKLLNTYISHDAKNKLDKLTKGSRRKINEVIEELINKEYEITVSTQGRKY